MSPQTELSSWIRHLGGTYTWRKIAGEARLSPHSFGMASDLNPNKGPYWRWSGGSSHPDQATYPRAIVELFEQNGFIWGGKWREYDLMLFEYRPEIICQAKRLASDGGGTSMEQSRDPKACICFTWRYYGTKNLQVSLPTVLQMRVCQ